MSINYIFIESDLDLDKIKSGGLGLSVLTFAIPYNPTLGYQAVIDGTYGVFRIINRPDQVGVFEIFVPKGFVFESLVGTSVMVNDIQTSALNIIKPDYTGGDLNTTLLVDYASTVTTGVTLRIIIKRL